MFKLMLLCDYAREPERRLLKGLTDFARTKGGWNYFIVPPAVYKDASCKDEVLERIRVVGADAVFGRWEGITKETADSLGIPIILRTVNQDYPVFPMASGDYHAIGRMGASFFLRQHYQSYAFWGYKNLLWSRQRIEGFMEVLKPRGMMVSIFETELGENAGERVRNWLRSLPKPVALMTCNDVLAQEATEACLETGIRIPDELALLGVDNDEFLCNIACPAISSINLDFERQGYEIGAALYKMRQEGTLTPLRIPVHPVNIQERESTLRHNISNPYIRRIVEFIDANYESPITMDDIVRDIPLSRRAIELYFKREMAPETIISYLYGLRIRLMCRYLSTTDMPVGLAAEKSGFSDVLNVGRTFKRFTGMTPTQYREKMIKMRLGAPDYSDAGNEEH